MRFLILFPLLSFLFIGNAQDYPTVGFVERLDGAINELIPEASKIEVLAEGFDWAEGPVWVSALNGLLFTDVPQNKAFKWSETEGLSEYLVPSGHTGIVSSSLRQGANGLALDRDGNLILCQHGDRRIAKLTSLSIDSLPEYETIADSYEGKRFHSPNDLVIAKDGSIYFTDPPYGLKDQDEDALRELSFNGVYKMDAEGQIQLLSKFLKRPNGVALSTDEKTLYVSNSYADMPVIIAIDISDEERLTSVFFDGSAQAEKDAGHFDGLKVHSSGNIFATGPGGVLIIDPQGKHLGTIRPEALTANCAFDPEGKVFVHDLRPFPYKDSTQINGGFRRVHDKFPFFLKKGGEYHFLLKNTQKSFGVQFITCD